MVKFSYYPGCTLKTKAKELDEFAKVSASLLGFELEEIEDWQCCGGIYPLGRDEVASKLPTLRALDEANKKGQDLVTLCSACHHVFKRVNDDIHKNEDFRTRANNYLQLENPYTGQTNVVHFLEVLRNQIGFEELKKNVVNPLKGRKIAAYYGCLLLRPSSVMQFDNAENPSIMEEFIKAIGATPVNFPYRNECCGGYISLKEKEISKSMSEKIMESAIGFGADTIITACPLCLYNLEKNKGDMKIEIVYFTELLAEALQGGNTYELK